jgi:hypothetical protein
MGTPQAEPFRLRKLNSDWTGELSAFIGVHPRISAARFATSGMLAKAASGSVSPALFPLRGSVTSRLEGSLRIGANRRLAAASFAVAQQPAKSAAVRDCRKAVQPQMNADARRFQSAWLAGALKVWAKPGLLRADFARAKPTANCAWEPRFRERLQPFQAALASLPQIPALLSV